MNNATAAAIKASKTITPIPVAKLIDQVKMSNLVRLIRINKTIGEKIHSITPLAINVELRLLANKKSWVAE